MKQTHRTARKENPGAGGRGPSRQRAHSFMGASTKAEWARKALDALDHIKVLEHILRRVPNYPVMVERYNRGEKSWCNMINELERDLEAAVPGCFKDRMPS